MENRPAVPMQLFSLDLSHRDAFIKFHLEKLDDKTTLSVNFRLLGCNFFINFLD